MAGFWIGLTIGAGSTACVAAMMLSVAVLDKLEARRARHEKHDRERGSNG
jgi:hypothetical protein